MGLDTQATLLRQLRKEKSISRENQSATASPDNANPASSARHESFRNDRVGAGGIYMSTTRTMTVSRYSVPGESGRFGNA